MFNQRRAIATLRSGERSSQPGPLEGAAQRGKFIAATLIGAFAAFLLPSTMLAQSGSYAQTNIVSDGSVPAQKTDPTLINPWGVSIGPAFWIDTAGTGFSLVDDASGNKQFSVTIPPAVATEKNGSPAGTVFNADPSVFTIPGSGSAQFIFGNLDGSIAAWNTTTAQPVTVVNNSSAKAVYTDIAVVKNNTGTFLLAANFAGKSVDVFDGTFKPAKLAGSFSDPNLPAGYSPFGIHTIGNNVYVAYAQVGANGFESVGAGLGVVDQFDLNGNLLVEAIVGGNLNAPWGMALAPAGFGTFGGDLLVGNFGDGVINAYDPASFALKGQITDATGAPIANPGLWEIVFGAGSTTTRHSGNSGRSEHALLRCRHQQREGRPVWRDHGGCCNRRRRLRHHRSNDKCERQCRPDGERAGEPCRHERFQGRRESFLLRSAGRGKLQLQSGYSEPFGHRCDNRDGIYRHGHSDANESLLRIAGRARNDSCRDAAAGLAGTGRLPQAADEHAGRAADAGCAC